MKYLFIALGLLFAFPVHAGGYDPMPSKECLKSSACVAEVFEDARQTNEESVKAVIVPLPKPTKAEPKRCVEKPGGWSEIEFYERNTWFFQTWGRLMTVEEKEAFRCGWPV